jgi:nitric oxide dioxygenase
MTPEQIEQVRTSFAKVVPIADQAAALFYGRLFETTPELRALFHRGMHVQGQKLMRALATVVDGLGHIEAIAPVVRDLAKRHVAYGVQPEHYPLVGAALLWTLEQGLGDEFTPTLRAAWATAYSALSEMMIAAAYPAPQRIRRKPRKSSAGPISSHASKEDTKLACQPTLLISAQICNFWGLGSSALGGGSDVIAAEMEEVIDLIVG